MKKVLLSILAVALVTTTLCSATAAIVTSGDTSQGVIRVESLNMPELNFEVPISRAAAIYDELATENITSICEKEYRSVRGKCAYSSDFVHNGVRVLRTYEGTKMNFDFSVPGYHLYVKGVSWDTLDEIFD
jgi:hypothetical protein